MVKYSNNSGLLSLTSFGKNQTAYTYIRKVNFQDSISKTDILPYKKIHCKKFLLDYGKSSASTFDYDDNLGTNPAKFYNYYIDNYLELCEKYTYSYKYYKNNSCSHINLIN